MRTQSNRGPTAISLFSGAGGLDLASHAAGFSTVAAIESVPRYAQTLSDNANLTSLKRGDEFDAWFNSQLKFMGRLTPTQIQLLRQRLLPGVGRPNAMSECTVLASDVKDVRTTELLSLVGKQRGEVDLVLGGPPCQSFSMSGQRKSITDIRGQLFLQFSRFVKDLQPRWFVFENVKGMTHSSALTVHANCGKCGPFMPAHMHVLMEPKADVYECPTCGAKSVVVRRKQDQRGALGVIINELSILGYTCHVEILSATDFGVPQFRERVFIVGSRDNEPFEMPAQTHGNSLGSRGGQAALWDRPNLLPVTTVWDVLFDSPNPSHDPNIDPERARLWVKNVVRPHAEPVTWTLRRPSPTVGSHQAAKLAIAPHGVPEEQVDRQQWHTRGRRQGDTPPVHVDHTYLSDSDLLTLQTFPSSWHVAGTRMERAFQIGNAVPPKLGAAVLGQVWKSLGQSPLELVAS